MPALEIVPYDDRWPLEFARERDRIAAALGPLALRIEHHGSTSVAGLSAKPVIDIQVSVAALRPLGRYAAPLLALGYVHVPHEDDDVCPYFHKPKAWPHTHHLHLVMAGGDNERRTLAFRDFLRDHPDVAREYESLKRRLALDHEAGPFASQQAYAEAKGPFIAGVTEQALSLGYPKTLGGNRGPG
ncbi:MAG TPA: GrpB family protein [Thermoanaerobaculia bacterium]|nr:GrpB family protein [Thermoanaerobaculia bacterium]